ncbi:copper homeostasis protein CutC [Rhodoferax aquaticus]|uniref:PF03932 family protein CutC n=1 Tax=Rhodoferax aquaticus TaxID=2527691 RepID=A0A515EW10_9BURK|nr:copper homeostasis protein CutC [Rhodoferax aquaticus]
MRAPLVEVCVDSAAGLAAAIAGGADRIELCSALAVGGLTPTAGLMALAAQSPVPVYAMVRPHPGDFVFTAADVDAMRHDIDTVRALGLAGVVLGANLADGQLDGATLHTLRQHAQGLGATLHRAFDMVPHIADAVEMAVQLRFERILSSGRAATALAGLPDLALTCQAAAGRISVMPGSGVRPDNVASLRAALPDVYEVHGACTLAAPYVHQRAIDLGFCQPLMRHTSAHEVRAMKAAVLT